jgi:integrase
LTEIIKQGAQILNAAEYEKIRSNLNQTHQLIFDGQLFTGMRIEEFWRFVEHPEWFHADRQYVELPPGSILKVKAKQKERLVLLSFIGTSKVRDLVAAIYRGEIKSITKQGWGQDLKRAALKSDMNIRGISPKMLRKTAISWLMLWYPNDGLRIASSAGHDTGTLIRHYMSIPFSIQEKEQIKAYVIGWGGNS